MQTTSSFRIGMIASTFMIAYLLAFPVQSIAQQSNDEKETEMLKKANNPLASMTALNFQNYYVPALTEGPRGSYMNTAWIRFATPFIKGRFLVRASLPFSTIAFPDSSGTVRAKNGLADANAFVSWNFISKPSMTIGAGPMFTAPTATDSVLGAGKWQGGLAFVAFIAKSSILQYGGLVTWQTSFAGNKDRPNTNLLVVQPFYFFQLGKGTYLRGAPMWAFNFENGTYNVPLALGIGKVVKLEKAVCNLFVEPQYTVLSWGSQPLFQLFMGINLQFPK
jgi:hypothetical protein